MEKAHKIGLLCRDARPFPTTLEDTRSPKLHTSESPGISLGETVTSRSMARQEATVEGSPCIFLSAARISISIICCLDNGTTRQLPAIPANIFSCDDSINRGWLSSRCTDAAANNSGEVVDSKLLLDKFQFTDPCSVRSSSLSLFPGIHISTGKHPVYQIDIRLLRNLNFSRVTALNSQEPFSHVLAVSSFRSSQCVPSSKREEKARKKNDLSGKRWRARERFVPLWQKGWRRRWRRRYRRCGSIGKSA